MASDLLKLRLELIAAKAKILASQNLWSDDLIVGLKEIAMEVDAALNEARGQTRNSW